MSIPVDGIRISFRRTEQLHFLAPQGANAEVNACADDDRMDEPSNIEVILSDPESALARCTSGQAEKEGFQPISASAESRDIGKLHLAGDDSGFGEFGRTRKRPD